MEKQTENSAENSAKKSGIALLPFLIFVGVYLGSGIVLQQMGVEMAFYQFPSPLASVIGIISAFFIIKGKFSDKFDTLIKGCGDSNIIIMCVIYLLAGGFAGVCKSMGAIDSTVNLGLTYIPAQYLTAGIFLIAAFISTATGTSVGSAVAVGPIAVDLAEKTGISMPLMLGCVMGGIMLGDNLSIISDTTIASTRTQGCSMKDKFRLNLNLTVIPALITVILLVLFSNTETIQLSGNYEYSLIKIIPYVAVIVAAIAGMNVFLVLIGGTILAGIIGIAYSDFGFLEFFQHTYKGFTSMTDIFLLSMLTGGLALMVSEAGGINYLIEKVQKFIKNNKTAQLGISSLVSLTDIAIANNTIAIIINGEIAKKICYKYNVDPRRSAALLSTFSTIFQGLVPYGAQMLIVSGFTAGKVSPIDILPYTWFIYLLGISAIASIFIPFSDGFIKKDPWNFEKQMPSSKVVENI